MKDINKTKTVAKWVLGELKRLLNKNKISIEDCKILPEQLALLLTFIDCEIINEKIAKSVFEEMFNTGKSPEEIITKRECIQILDRKELLNLIKQVIDENEEFFTNRKTINNFQADIEKLINFLMGQVMKISGGRANPIKLNELLHELHIQSDNKENN
jgi:aspartyl-tRNA(Asn)/glutamyl-tRNA(Gln) amidotransferase subunit B